jgi:hypothetical protein
MDHTTEVISSYAMSLDYSHIPPDTVHETKRHENSKKYEEKK